MAERKRQPQPQASPPNGPPPPAPGSRAAAVAGILALGAGAAAGGAALAGPPILTATVLAGLTRLFVRWGYRRHTIRYALRVTTRVVRPASPGAPSPAPGGAAEAANARAERTFAAWFIERTTARVEAAYQAGAAEGEPEAREDRFIDQHLDAQEARRKAAQRVDAEAAKPGNVTDRPEVSTGGDDQGDPPRVILRWRAHPDDKTTPECAAADGAWFYADTPPIIGYPGMPHGGTCRCWPAHAGSLAEVARGRHVNEAVRGIISVTPDHRPHPGRRDEDDERRTA